MSFRECYFANVFLAKAATPTKSKKRKTQRVDLEGELIMHDWWLVN